MKPLVAAVAVLVALAAGVPVQAQTLAGNVYLDSRSFADDDGTFNGFGISLFWAMWAAHDDEARLLSTLDWAASWGVTYIRALSMVGTPYWDGRVIDPAWSDYHETLTRLLDACAERQLRVQMVLFADAQVMMPDRNDRRAWVETMARWLEAKRHVVAFVEIANESTLNGVTDDDLRELTLLWDETSDIPVAPSSPDGGNAEESINRLFDDRLVGADLLTPHFDRRLTEDNYRPHRQPWETQFYNTPTTVFVNNEPIGPGSSGESDVSPSRLASGLLGSFMSGAAGHVLHSSAGVRGDDPYWDVVSDEIMTALRATLNLLPAGIANGERCNHTWDCHPYHTDEQIWTDHGGVGGVVRAYASMWNGHTYVGVMGMRETYTVTAKASMTVEVFSVLSGERLEVVELAPDETFVFTQHGTLRDYLHRITRH